jgi:hypothetical protein
MSLSAYSQAPRGSSGLREPDKSKRASVQTTNLRRVADIKDMEDEKDGHDGAYWFNRGFELHQSSRYVDAIEAFSQSIALNHRQATAMYNIACGFALLNDTENVVLLNAAGRGFDQTDLFENRFDLDPLRLTDSRRYCRTPQSRKDSKSSSKRNRPRQA